MNVYLLKQLGYIKIGKADDIFKRVKQLQTATPEKIEYIASKVVDNPLELENHLHVKYSQFKSSGEWFKLTEEHVNEIIQDYNFEINHNVQKRLSISNKSCKDTHIIGDFKTMVKRVEPFYITKKEYHPDFIGDLTWDEYFESLFRLYGDLAKNILLLGDSFKNQKIVDKIYCDSELTSKEMNWIKSVQSFESSYYIDDLYKDFLKAIVYKENTTVTYRIYDEFIKYYFALCTLTYNVNNNNYNDKLFIDIIKMTKDIQVNIEIINTLELFIKNKNKTYCSNKIKKLLYET